MKTKSKLLSFGERAITPSDWIINRPTCVVCNEPAGYLFWRSWKSRNRRFGKIFVTRRNLCWRHVGEALRKAEQLVEPALFPIFPSALPAPDGPFRVIQHAGLMGVYALIGGLIGVSAVELTIWAMHWWAERREPNRAARSWRNRLGPPF